MEISTPPILDPYITRIAELEKENEKLRGQVQWYVNRVAEGYFGGPGLKGYQELGQMCAKLENQVDGLKAELKTALSIIEAMKEQD